MIDARRLLDQFLGSGRPAGIKANQPGASQTAAAAVVGQAGWRHARRAEPAGARKSAGLRRAGGRTCGAPARIEGRPRDRRRRAEIRRHGPDRRARLQGLSGLPGAAGRPACRNRRAPEVLPPPKRHAVHAEGERGGGARAAARDGDDLRRQGRRLHRSRRAEAHLRAARFDEPRYRIEGLCDGSAARAARPRRHRARGAASRRSRRRSTQRRCSRSIRIIRPKKPISRCSRRGSGSTTRW